MPCHSNSASALHSAILCSGAMLLYATGTVKQDLGHGHSTRSLFTMLHARTIFIQYPSDLSPERSPVAHFAADVWYPTIQTPMLLQTNNTTAVETYRMPPSIDFAMRVIAFILFLVTMNAIVDALELRQRHAKKYQEQNERAGHFRRTSRV